MKAILTNRINGMSVQVHATTEHPDSSYGQPVWVDDDNQAYCQVGMESPFYYISNTAKQGKTKKNALLTKKNSKKFW